MYLISAKKDGEWVYMNSDFAFTPDMTEAYYAHRIGDMKNVWNSIPNKEYKQAGYKDIAIRKVLLRKKVWLK